MNSDFKDLLRFLNEERVNYLVVRGYAVMHHSQPRYTKDLDIWIQPSLKNAEALMRVLQKFGIPLMGLTIEDFASVGTQLNLGVEPCQIDLLTAIPGLEFEPAWASRVTTDAEGFPIHYLGKSDLIKAKQTAGRPQDLADLDELRRADLDFE